MSLLASFRLNDLITPTAQGQSQGATDLRSLVVCVLPDGRAGRAHRKVHSVLNGIETGTVNK